MEKMLVKMSRRRSLMVPVVTLVAIGIGISGYYIQEQQIVAREQASEQTQTTKTSQSQPQSVDSSRLSTVETVDPTTKVTESGEPAKVVAVELEVENEPENSEVVITAKVDTKAPGNCVFTLKQAQYGPEETVKIKDGRCEARLQNPGIGEWEARVLYTSTDGKTRGDASQSVEL